MRKAVNILVLEDQLIYHLQWCKSLKQLRQIQTQILAHGIQHSVYIAPRLVAAFGRLQKMGPATLFFDRFPNPTLPLCNAMLRGYLQIGLSRDVLLLLLRMKRLAVQPDCYTYPLVLRSCVRISALKEGQQVHCDSMKSGFQSDPVVGTALIDVYSMVKLTRSAYKVFAEMLSRSVVAWTSMIRAYLTARNVNSARRLFDLAPEKDLVLWNIMMSGYIEIGDMDAALDLFHKFPNRDPMAWNTMLNGYANAGDVTACQNLFEQMPMKNIFSWNALIGAFSHSESYFEVIASFKRMLMGSDVLPNDATLVTVLSACSRLGALDTGKWVHSYAENNALMENVYVQNALIDMYAKCGVVEKAIDIFNSMIVKDIISWNSIIGGLAINGRGMDALKLFTAMRNEKEKPDGVTFLGVLCACMHMGLVEDGLLCFQIMVHNYSIVPQIEHYGCMVDLLARSGHVNRAVEFIMEMPMTADAVIWAALLGACRIYKNIEIAEFALERLVELEPSNPSNYVMLSNIYKDAARWKDVAGLKVALRDTRSKKVPGCSLVEVGNNVVEFYSLDERHPKSEEIYQCLQGLTNLLRISGYLPDIQVLAKVNLVLNEMQSSQSA